MTSKINAWTKKTNTRPFEIQIPEDTVAIKSFTLYVSLTKPSQEVKMIQLRLNAYYDIGHLSTKLNPIQFLPIESTKLNEPETHKLLHINYENFTVSNDYLVKNLLQTI